MSSPKDLRTTVIAEEPDRTHYQYTWDVKGQVTNIKKVSDERRRARAQTGGSSSISSIFWPFGHQSTNGADNATLPSKGSHMRRRASSAGWDPIRPASSVLDMDIVPDYVINFMRGETPESLAQKRDRPQGARNPTYHMHAHKQSCQAAFYDDSLRLYEDLEKAQSRSPRYLKRIMTGWRGGVALNWLLAFVILLTASVCLMVLLIRARTLPPHSTLRTGQCGTIRNFNTGMHLIFNVVAVILLAGASYVFQVLTSPTRSEIDAAHMRRQYLDIGIPSFRNLILISRTRALLATMLLPLAVGSYVIYNALLSVTVNQDALGRNISDIISEAESCSLTVNGPLVAVLAVVNLIIVLGATMALAIRRLKPLATLGDAIQSFLSDPDPLTQDACLLTKSDIKSGKWGERQAKVWKAETHRWMQTPSMARWAIWASSWLAPLVGGAVALGLSLSAETQNAFTSFNQINSAYVLPFGPQRFASAIVAALPHLLLAVLYFSTNALLTLFFLSHELSQFAVPNRFTPLRVSTGQPVGSQKTSLYITLPRPVSWVLLFLFSGMSFILSQAVYLISAEGEKGWEGTLAISPLPLAVLLGLLLVLGSIVFSLALRKTDPTPTVDGGRPAGNPLALKGGSCSAVISARCHRAATEGEDMTLHAISWGVVGGEAPGAMAAHAAFSMGPVGAVNVGEGYA
ncbi:hypothetical protein B0I35DRAFT_422380 [Stachybotrys elegans]|uniref:DUF6536 domain-containing protein n=1 Tax=Stachybotrys elegans TaxID=80388 RepID=A0A8K0SYY5_9HYPO|nr:hypothetical protein B0I35DRAFT_422380 [Stachybotrys elegans]